MNITPITAQTEPEDIHAAWLQSVLELLTDVFTQWVADSASTNAYTRNRAFASLKEAERDPEGACGTTLRCASLITKVPYNTLLGGLRAQMESKRA